MRLTFKRKFSLSVLALLLSVSTTAMAEQVVFASAEAIPPYIFTENGKLKGTAVDTIREVCRRLKLEPVFQQYPWARAIKMAKNGKVDAVFPPLKTEEREAFLYFPQEPLSYTRNVVFANKTRKIKIQKLEDLTQYTVGINAAYSYGPVFDNYKKHLTLELNQSEEMQVNKLLHHGKVRMDLVVADENVFRYLTRRAGVSEQVEMVYVISKSPNYVAFSKAKGEKARLLAENFNKILTQLRTDGTLQKIMERY